MRPSVLIAEDDFALRSLFAKIFDFAGFDVTCAADGSETLTCLNLRLPDVLVMDVNMPGPTGLHILEQMKQRAILDRVHTILVTGNTNAAQYSEADYADLVLIKPVDAGDLVTLARRLVAAAA